MRADMERTSRRNITSWLIFLLVLAISTGYHGVFGKIKYKTEDGRHNITMGTRNTGYPKDQLLFHDNPQQAGSMLLWPKVLSYDVCYPPKKGSDSKKITITAFNVTDRLRKGKGGYAFVASGGVGSDGLCLHLKSQRGGGYDFDIDIYGY